MSPTNQLTLPLRSSIAQQAKRQREESEGEPQAKAKRVRWADSEPEWGQQADLPSSQNYTGSDNEEIVENVITVLVDNDQHRFFVREDIICVRSGLFQAMVSSSASQEKVVSIPTVSSDAFRMYIGWLKTRSVSLKTWFNQPGRDLDVTEQEELQAYIDIYVLAENLEDRKLRRYVMKVFINNCHDLRTIPGGEWCTAVWKQTSKGSLLRTFIVEWTFFRFAYLASSDKFASEAMTYSEEFREEFVEIAFERGLPPSGNRPNGVAKRAFQDAMRATLLERRSK
ncbi:hypothetical protein MBLNU13_g08282t2 [Cladosporium sp. NU13]